MSKAKVNGVELYYEIMGEGEPVAFLNGILMTTDRWSGETEFLKTKYKCILHDTRGQFRSEKPEGDYTMELHAEDFISLLDHLDI
ncbi:MAG: alpha/beta hydrolase, partial [Deltaproteobacteria bacterium]